MRKSIKNSFRQNIIIITIALTVIFAVMNVSLYAINVTYLRNKINEENEAFLSITRHILNENDVSIALEYIEHYTHIHEVEIEVVDEDDIMLFSSKTSHRFTHQYTIETNKGVFTIYLDNTESTTVSITQKNIIYINASLIVIYLVSVVSLYYLSKRGSRFVQGDLAKVLELIDNKENDDAVFEYDEFQKIHRVLNNYLASIDLLKEQKEMNMKSLAHDIKTPLTLVYNYLDRVRMGKPVSEKELNNSITAASKINSLLTDLIDENYQNSFVKTNLTTILIGLIDNYKPIFDKKNIRIDSKIENLTFMWNAKDFTRIIENIISNAYYYSDENTTFRIELSQSEFITLRFTSTSSRLDQVDTSKLFDKGYYENISDTSKTSKGLGLYICKLLLAPINGKIDAVIEKNQFILEIII